MSSLTRPGDTANPSQSELARVACGPYTPQATPTKIGPAMVSTVVQIMLRQIQDAMAEATVAYWLRRAIQFDAVHPDIKPLPLNAHPDWVAESPAAVQTALACRQHAWILRDAEIQDADEVADYVADEVAA